MVYNKVVGFKIYKSMGSILIPLGTFVVSREYNRPFIRLRTCAKLAKLLFIVSIYLVKEL